MGLIHIYCGDGKGKTTASLGLALRASGRGMRVHIVQLLKGCDTGELSSLKALPNITCTRLKETPKFSYQMSDDEKAYVTKCHNELLENVKEMLDDIDLLIIDEFNSAYQLGLVDKTLADEMVLNKPEHLELVLTGCNPDKKFVDVCDYLSEIKAIKHPYNKGITARKGIEY